MSDHPGVRLHQPLGLLLCITKDVHNEQELVTVVLMNGGGVYHLVGRAILDSPFSARGLASKLS